MSPWLWLAAVAVVVVLAAAVALRFAGPERIWTVFGPADLGPVRFEELERSKTPNDALVCPSGFCPAESDIMPPVFPVDAAVLRKAMRRALLSERRLTLVAVEDVPPSDRYVQRSEMMRFPDTVAVRYLDLEGGRSTVAIYSRSQIGRSDLGVNLKRIERWLEKLAQEVRKEKPSG